MGNIKLKMATPLAMRVFNFTSKVSRSLLTSQSRSSRCSCCLSTSADSNATSAGEKPDNTAQKEDKAGEEMAAQIKKLQEEIKEGKDRYMRALAESENVRRRMTKQVDDAKVFGIQGFCKDLLE